MNNLWDRREERTELWFHFEKGRNISMFAPRRLGKSWLMKNLLRKEAAGKGWQAVYCDLQSANSYEKAVLTLINDLQKHGNAGDSLLTVAKAKFKGILQGEPASFKELLSHTDPENLLDAILSHLNQDSQEKPTLILLDEVTICASNIMKTLPTECYQLLNSLRTQLEPEYTPEQLREALNILSNDGFIKKQANGKYRFVMQLLAPT